MKQHTNKVLNTQLAVCTGIALTWMAFGIWFAQDWFHDIVQRADSVFGVAFASFFILFIALVPGFIQVFHYIGLIFHSVCDDAEENSKDTIAVLISAFNEGKGLANTLDSLFAQRYKGKLLLYIMDYGSSYDTLSIAQSKTTVDLTIKVYTHENKGKAASLNDLMTVVPDEVDYILTVDADCYLHPLAIQRLIDEHKHTGFAATAGTVFVLNERASWWTRIQKWEYALGILHVKRVQGHFGCTSVCQGALSIYNKSVIEELGGWKETAGEDIVLSWDMLARNYRTGHCDTALCLTNVPTTRKALYGQRRRWARGLIESIASSPHIMVPKRRFTVFNWMLLMLPIIDYAYIFLLLPWMIKAIVFGYTLLVGKFFYLVLATGVTLNFINYWLYIRLMKRAFSDVKITHDPIGFILYSTIYGYWVQMCALVGYIDQLMVKEKKWWR